MNLLEDAFNSLSLKGVCYHKTSLYTPWQIKIEKQKQSARCYFLKSGRCYIKFDSGRTVCLYKGDLIIMPKDIDHLLCDQIDSNANAADEYWESSDDKSQNVFAIEAGVKKNLTELICGNYLYFKGSDHPILRAFPEYLHISAAQINDEYWLNDMLLLLIRRTFTDQKKAKGVVHRLSESVFLEVLRITVSENKQLKANLRAFGDKRICKALNLIHGETSNSWSVQSLAKRIGMSRSRFAERFAELIGMSPMAYLVEMRLQKALFLLDNSDLNIQQIASKTGFLSLNSFSRAFTNRIGDSPSKYRRSSLKTARCNLS